MHHLSLPVSRVSYFNSFNTSLRFYDLLFIHITAVVCPSLQGITLIGISIRHVACSHLQQLLYAPSTAKALLWQYLLMPKLYWGPQWWRVTLAYVVGLSHQTHVHPGTLFLALSCSCLVFGLCECNVVVVITAVVACE